MKQWIINHKVEIGAIFGITIAASLLTFMPGITLGHDLFFHLLRIDGIADELSQGHFPVRLQSIWLDDYGSPVSIFYGDLLLYFPAILHLFGLGLTKAYELYLFFVNFATAILSFICFKQIFKNRNIALTLSLVYTTASYRLVDIFVRSSVGEYTSFLFFPLVALAFYRIYFSKTDTILKNTIILSFGMSGLILTHILSTEMTVLVLGFLCLIFCKKTFSKKVLLTLISSVFLTFLLCAYFIVPFMDYFLNVPVYITNSDRWLLQPGGVYFSQLFAFFQTPFGGDTQDVYGRMLFSPGIALMAGLVFSVIYLIYYKRDNQLIILLFLSCFTIFLSSNLFPWDLLSVKKIGKLISQIQFSWRWLGFVAFFMTLLLGRLLILSEQDFFKTVFMQRIVQIVVISMVLLQSFTFTSDYIDGASNYVAEDYTVFGSVQVGNQEYVRVGTDIDKRSGEIVSDNVIISDLSRNKNNFSFHAVSTAEGFIELPLFNYKGYQAISDSGTKMNITDGENNVVRINIPAMFDGNIEVHFVEPFLWRISEIISLLTILIVIFSISISKVKQRKKIQ